MTLQEEKDLEVLWYQSSINPFFDFKEHRKAKWVIPKKKVCFI